MDDQTLSQGFGDYPDYDEQWEQTEWLVTLRGALERNIGEAGWITDDNRDEIEFQRKALEIVDEFLDEGYQYEQRYTNFKDFIITFNQGLKNRIEEIASRDENYKNYLKFVAGAITTGVALTYYYNTYSEEIASQWTVACAARSGAARLGFDVTQCLPQNFINYSIEKFKENYQQIISAGLGTRVLSRRLGRGMQFLKKINDKIKTKINDYRGGTMIDYEDLISNVADEVSNYDSTGFGRGLTKKKRKSNNNKTKKGKHVKKKKIKVLQKNKKTYSVKKFIKHKLKNNTRRN